ncbi:putative kinesin-like protein [Helianthus anomalus]
MNPFGRSNMQRSGSNGGHHHHRQYPSSDDFTESNFNNKWLQSAGLHHLYSSNPNFQVQDFGFYGSNNDAASSRSSSFTKYGNVEQVSPNEFSPGLLDLHSFDDTELLTEVHSENNLNLLNQPLYGEGVDGANTYSLANKFANMSCGPVENNVVKSSLADKEKASNVAKIKVVVRKRPLNKKELARNEQDIISIDPYNSSLTVHESKVKVSI